MIDERARSPAAGSMDSREPLRATDHFVPHVSTVPVIAGQPVDIFVREKIREDHRGPRPAVLMIHGGFSHGALAFDLPYKTYSWMDDLAQAGFAVFAMDMTGYGQSARPMMDNPNNVGPKQRSIVLPSMPPGEMSYPFELATVQSECDEIDCVVDFICKSQGVTKVSLIGWSAGGIRAGFYASRHPGKVDRLIIIAAAKYEPDGSSAPPATIPAPGFPMLLQTRETAEIERWNPFVRCEGQLDPGIQDVIWNIAMASDPLGASWGPGVMRAPNRTYWGWNSETAARITAPTLIVVGEFDKLMASNRKLFGDLGATDKAFLDVACASHFVVWEAQHGVIHGAAREWLLAGACGGKAHGEIRADSSGRLSST